MTKPTISLECGEFWVSPSDLPEKEPLRSVMSLVLDCQPSCCRDKKVYLRLVKSAAKEIINQLKKG